MRERSRRRPTVGAFRNETETRFANTRGQTDRQIQVRRERTVDASERSYTPYYWRQRRELADSRKEEVVEGVRPEFMV